MKLSKSSAASAYNPGCPSHRMVKGWRSNRGYMFAMMLAMLALMAVMGVGLSRLMMTTKATTQMQRTQDNKQLLSSLVMTLSSKAADSDGDFVLEPPAFSTETITGFAAPTNGGFVGTDVANTDAWGRRLGYCAYDYGSAAVTPTTGTGLIRGSTTSSPTDSWVAVVVISAGPDGVINTPCPAVDTAASSVVATGDDMVAARSYGEMVSFGNAQIASSLSGMGTNSTNKLCRLGSDGKMICDIKTGLSSSNTANRLCRTDASGTLQCSTEATTCAAGQASKWNGSSFECVAVGIGGSGGICRMDGGGNVVCDIKTNLTSSNTPYRLCRIDAFGVFNCDIPSYLGVPGGWNPGGECYVDTTGYLRCTSWHGY